MFKIAFFSSSKGSAIELLRKGFSESIQKMLNNQGTLIEHIGLPSNSYLEALILKSIAEDEVDLIVSLEIILQNQFLKSHHLEESESLSLQQEYYH